MNTDLEQIMCAGMQSVFCRQLLSSELPEETPGPPPFELNVLRTPEFLELSEATDPALSLIHI